MAQLADRLVSPPALAEIAAGTGLSRYQLVRSFRTEVGMPPYAWLAQYRVRKAQALLERGCRPAEAAALTGFADQAHSDQVVPAGGRSHPRRVPQQRSRQRPAVPVMLAFQAACRWRPTSAECGVR